jgi:hypothetical protein
MLSAELDRQILEVHAHNEQWSFVNGGAEVCAILFFTYYYKNEEQHKLRQYNSRVNEWS